MALAPEYAGIWDIDPSHSRLGFSTRHAMVARVRGAFNGLRGELHLDPESMPDSAVRVRVDAASIDTRDGNRDNHLRSADFFDVERYPEITFASTSIDEIEDDNFIVTGDLTIRDVTRQISLPLEFVGVERDPMGALRAGVEGSRRIDRKDWGVSWNTPLDSGGLLVSDKITLELELSLVKRQ
ncbi:MAG: YceI family protein [Microbacteriaceae bacterium]|nr:YceI family protein [Microbacteriaceae bacterium]